LGGPGGGGALAPGAGGAPGALGGPGGGGALAPGAGGAPGALGGPGGGGPPPLAVAVAAAACSAAISCLMNPQSKVEGTTNFSGLMNRLKNFIRKLLRPSNWPKRALSGREDPVGRSLTPSNIAKRPSANKSLICWSC
jgi:hypothetical protein